MITIASQSHPARPPTQFMLRSWRARWPGGVAGRWARVASVETVVAMSGPLELTAAAAQSAQEQGQGEADDHEDGRDRAGQAHLVALEAADVHVQGEVPGGVGG